MSKTLLIVHHTPSPYTQEMFEAVVAGACDPQIEGVEVVRRPALSVSPSDMLAADGYLLGTPANLGYMSGALKHAFDVCYYPASTPRAGDRSASTSTATRAPRAPNAPSSPSQPGWVGSRQRNACGVWQAEQGRPGCVLEPRCHGRGSVDGLTGFRLSASNRAQRPRSNDAVSGRLPIRFDS